MDYATYWTSIFGDRSAEDVIRELDPHYPTLESWLAQVEEEARVQGAALDDDDVSAHRRAALEELEEALAAALAE